MPEAEDTLSEESAFRRVPLERVGELRDIKGIKGPFLDSFFKKLDEAHTQFPAVGSIEQIAINEVMRKHRISIELSGLGGETWKEHGTEGVVTEKWQEPVAGVYMAILGVAQEISPEGLERIKQARPLSEGAEKDFMALSKYYDDMVDDALMPGCFGRLLGRKGKTMDDVASIEKKVVASLEKTPGA